MKSQSVLPKLMAGAEPFFMPGGPVGCLCLHGFTANPSETRWLGQTLSQHGFTVYGARLAGHGTDPEDLARTRWRDWLASALDGYTLLRQTCSQVCIVGHSMGGLLALLLAAQVETTALSVLASPVTFPSRLAAARLLKYIQPYTDQSDTSGLQDIIRAEQARRGEPITGRVRYDRWSTAAVAELYEVARVTAWHLPTVTAPLQLIYSRADSVVAPHNAERLAERVGSRVIEQRWLETSGHIVTQDSEREQVFAWVGAFFQQQSTSD